MKYEICWSYHYGFCICHDYGEYWKPREYWNPRTKQWDNNASKTWRKCLPELVRGFCHEYSITPNQLQIGNYSISMSNL